MAAGVEAVALDGAAAFAAEVTGRLADLAADLTGGVLAAALGARRGFGELSGLDVGRLVLSPVLGDWDVRRAVGLAPDERRLVPGLGLSPVLGEDERRLVLGLEGAARRVKVGDAVVPTALAARAAVDCCRRASACAVLAWSGNRHEDSVEVWEETRMEE